MLEYEAMSWQRNTYQLLWIKANGTQSFRTEIANMDRLTCLFLSSSYKNF